MIRFITLIYTFMVLSPQAGLYGWVIVFNNHVKSVTSLLILDSKIISISEVAGLGRPVSVEPKRNSSL